MAEPDPPASELDWRERRPPVLWPVPLVEAPPLAGKETVTDLVNERVVLGDTDEGLWRYDLRLMTTVHTRDGRQVVGLLPEIDWYRRRRDESYVCVPRSIPATQVWYELHQLVDREDEPTPPDQSRVARWRRSTSLVHSWSQPPVRWPRNCADERAVIGARCWIGGTRPGYRIASEPTLTEAPDVNLSGGLDGLNEPVLAPALRVLPEREWYRWLDTGISPPRRNTMQVEANIIWLE